MERQEYRRLAEREHFYFWNIGRREIIQEALRRNLATSDNEILDVGCGPGGNIYALQNFGRVTGLDLAEEALQFAKDLGFVQLIKSDACNMPLPDASFDLVSSLDVLEHINNDEKVMTGVMRLLKSDGIFLVTVPAFPWLWSAHDEALHHVRRYTKQELLLKLKRAGFKIKECSYFVMPAVPINLLRKLYKKEGSYDIDPSPMVNQLFLFLLRCERYLMRFVSLPFGSSLMVVAQKPRL